MIERGIVNVGIKDSQKKQIKALLKYGESVNAFVQAAVQEKLNQYKQRKKE